MGTPRVCRPADYLPSGTVGQWPLDGGTNEGAATLEPTTRPRGLTHNSRAGNPKRLRTNCHSSQRGALKTAWVAQNREGAQGPSVRRGGDPRTLASRRHFLLQFVAATASVIRVDGLVFLPNCWTAPSAGPQPTQKQVAQDPSTDIN